jgi:hypothetical protein
MDALRMTILWGFEEGHLSRLLVVLIIVRSFVPRLGITYLALQFFRVKRRLIESFAGWVWGFSVSHDSCLEPSGRLSSLSQP